MPTLFDEEITATYAGLRAAIDHGDYLIDVDTTQRYVLVGGIRSTGLTSGMAVAEYLMELLAGTEPGPQDPRRTPAATDDAQHRRGLHPPLPGRRRIAADPAYGKIVCFCERVTAGEIRDAFQSLIPPRGLDGLRRRTRVMNGRCQGFYCGAEVQHLLDSQAATTSRGHR